MVNVTVTAESCSAGQESPTAEADEPVCTPIRKLESGYPIDYWVIAVCIMLIYLTAGSFV